MDIEFRHKGACRKAHCKCSVPGPVCEEFMGHPGVTYCDRCGWERGAHLFLRLHEGLIDLLRGARVEAEAAQNIFAMPYSSHDAEIAFHETRGVQRGVAMAVELLISKGRP